ncbi:cyclophilin-like fold protein [Pseudomonas sp. 3A(2025)]
MRWITTATAALVVSLSASVMAQERISISSEWGNVTATLVDNAATQALIKTLPVTLQMSDHLRQEKTGDLPVSLPQAARQQDFLTGTLGLWGPDHFVIYYRSGRVPNPGIVILGQVTGDVSIFDRPGAVQVRVERLD